MKFSDVHMKLGPRLSSTHIKLCEVHTKLHAYIKLYGAYVKLGVCMKLFRCAHET